MGLRTALTTLLGVEHPIVLAPMGGVAGGELAAAVSRAGGLGLLGAGGGARDWLTQECDVVRRTTDRPWGIGLLAWAADDETVAACIAEAPAAIMLSFGDPTPFAPAIRDAHIPLLVQVTSVADARRAVEAGADVVVAQGAEAGGHGEDRATLPFVPAVVDVADGTPIVAAGGIADGRGLAAALVLGAAGAMLGTRFEATHEALLSAEERKAILGASAPDTVRDRVLDVVRESPWPRRFTARTLRNRVTDTWRGREESLRVDAAAKTAFREGVDRRDMDVLPVWAGEAVDLVNTLESAADLVVRIAADAEDAIRAGHAQLDP